ncbi:hypothetical protein [Desmospora profundinema]|uniref:Carbonic anhydrase n=1 Tax=Desmospora profundinema TaxID=1571184 RepID=A0ABU1IGY0_9BACL|nr:hypothetical protein [Desmospora profundinema]MDR6224037.1 carbonic anhydrase [Desmospora profundinema]
MDDVDAACLAAVETLRHFPLFRKKVVVHGYVYEVESGALRIPYHQIEDRVDTARETAKGTWGG